MLTFFVSFFYKLEDREEERDRKKFRGVDSVLKNIRLNLIRLLNVGRKLF